MNFLFSTKSMDAERYLKLLEKRVFFIMNLYSWSNARFPPESLSTWDKSELYVHMSV